MTKRFTIFALAIACTACLHERREQAALPGATDGGAVIVRLVSRDTVLTARTGRAGPVYSMHTRTRDQIVPSMTLDELTAQHPDVAKHVRSLHAVNETGIFAGVE